MSTSTDLQIKSELSGVRDGPYTGSIFFVCFELKFSDSSFSVSLHRSDYEACTSRSEELSRLKINKKGIW